MHLAYRIEVTGNNLVVLTPKWLFTKSRHYQLSLESISIKKTSKPYMNLEEGYILASTQQPDMELYIIPKFFNDPEGLINTLSKI